MAEPIKDLEKKVPEGPPEYVDDIESEEEGTTFRVLIEEGEHGHLAYVISKLPDWESC